MALRFFVGLRAEVAYFISHWSRWRKTKLKAFSCCHALYREPAAGPPPRMNLLPLLSRSCLRGAAAVALVCLLACARSQPAPPPAKPQAIVLDYGNGWYHPATGDESLGQIAQIYDREPKLVAQLNQAAEDSRPAKGTMVYVPPVNDREQVRLVLARINRDPKSVPTTPWNPKAQAEPAAVESKKAGSSKKSVYRPPIVEDPKGDGGNKDFGPGPGPSSTVKYAAPSDGFSWPLKGEVVSPFKGGWDHPMHGIELATTEGAPILASRAGKVLLARKYLSYGNLIVIDHGDGYVTNYAYLLKPLVKENDRVERGQQIATAGYPPDSTRSKLFFQIRRNGTPVDPMAFLK